MLMMQGLAAMGYYRVPYINEMLLGITILMLVGVAIINIGANKKSLQIASNGLEKYQINQIVK